LLRILKRDSRTTGIQSTWRAITCKKRSTAIQAVICQMRACNIRLTSKANKYAFYLVLSCSYFHSSGNVKDSRRSVRQRQGTLHTTTAFESVSTFLHCRIRLESSASLPSLTDRCRRHSHCHHYLHRHRLIVVVVIAAATIIVAVVISTAVVVVAL